MPTGSSRLLCTHLNLSEMVRPTLADRADAARTWDRETMWLMALALVVWHIDQEAPTSQFWVALQT